MSADDPSSPPGLAARIQSVLDGVTRASDDDSSKKTAEPYESRYSGLRDLAKQKETWSIWLRGILIAVFVLQVALLVAVLAGREMDVWTTRGILLQSTAMFVAALRFLFK